MDGNMVAKELLGLAKELMAAGKKPDARIRRRLEYLRKEIEAERISQGEISELQDLAEYIDPGDVLLLEWAGVPEGKRRKSTAKDLVAMDFPDQKMMDKYLKEHPDADRSNHKVVQHDPSKPETHPYNLMRQRKNEEKMKEIGKHYKKKPEDLTVEEITKYNQSRKATARELLVIAKSLLAMEFGTKEEMEQYKKDHDVRPGTKMKVVETKKAPAKKEQTKLPEREDVENAFRDHLSGTGRKVTKESMKSVMRNQFKGLTDIGFDNVWNDLVKEEYLMPEKDGGYKWEV